ncbi:MAG TPA: tannase/feruloyl esterase family alpha/beta hydrolase [Terracidiphilus sp.]|nr:tannase/feruloyl esterase family alpha/beta hydrolase [Terracidiphilus sp.]
MRIVNGLCGSLMALTAMFSAGQMGSPAAAGAANIPCEKLASLSLPNATVTLAEVVEAGAYPAPPDPFGGPSDAAFWKRLPAFCRVVVHSHPSADSDIPIEIWMPMQRWNGKLQSIGNGGFAGSIGYGELGAALASGYAAAGTDTGHSASLTDARWALGHPEKVADFGYRGIHEMTLAAKAVVQNFYAAGVKRAYFAGCSDGGREALMEAQRFPEDYDGILAGAPANNWTALLTTGIADTLALTAKPESFIPQAKIPAIAKAVLAKCDEMDGVKDGILNDPRQCHFDPATIECKAGEDTDACLTAAQVTALKALYAGARDGDGRQIFPGYLPGAEEGGNGWGTWIFGSTPGRSLMALFGKSYFSDMVYDKADWDQASFTVENALSDAREKTAAALDAVNPDLSAFEERGGKLILYHGWDDPAIAALNTVNYYETVEAKLGRSATNSFVRLYMLPGVQHCGGGPGPDMFGQALEWQAHDPEHNARVALEFWVEKGTAPGPLVATKMGGQAQSVPVMTRPICPYPQSARYKGKRDTNKAKNFVCAAPGK